MVNGDHILDHLLLYEREKFMTNPPKSVLVIGDSLVLSSTLYSTVWGLARGFSVIQIGRGGSAACDFADVPQLLEAYQPTDLVMAFVGNAQSQCMYDALGWSVRKSSLTDTEVRIIGQNYRMWVTRHINAAKAAGVVPWVCAPPRVKINNGTYHWQVNQYLDDSLSYACQLAGLPYDRTIQQLLCPTNVFLQEFNGLPIRNADGIHLAEPYGTRLHAMGLLNGPLG
jgi:hypothetical protein